MQRKCSLKVDVMLLLLLLLFFKFYYKAYLKGKKKRGGRGEKSLIILGTTLLHSPENWEIGFQLFIHLINTWCTRDVPGPEP